MLVFIFKFSNDELELPWADRRLNDPTWAKLREYATFYEAQLKHIHSQIDGEISTLECPVCHNDIFDVEAEVCLLCGHREDVLSCKHCKADYLYSQVEYGEEAGLCPRCEYLDGYAAANFEKY